MARRPGRRDGKDDSAAPRRKKGGGRKDRDPGGDTSTDGLVNALESDPEFFKDPLVGQQLDKCRIEKCLGEGKTGVVYRATYEPLNRTVAVKVLQRHMTKLPAVVRVFQQEGRAVAALDHENILKIYDVGEDRGHHYLVLELLRGRDLLHRIEQEEGGLPVEEALEYVRQAAAGLRAAHRKNLVHRDIKPQNLVVEPDGTLKIVDFGLAAEAEGAFAGGRLGTPHYMSPEQCRGEAAVTASDIYSLGITLFHMLVGQPPYKGLQSTEEIIQKHLEGKRLEPEKLRSDIPRRVADLVRKMTRMDPAARPTAKDILEIIEKLTPDRLARGAAGGPKRRRSARSRDSSQGPLIAIGGVVVILVLILLVVMNRGGDEANAPPAGGTTTAPPPPPRDADTAAKPAPVERTLEAELTALMADARAEEKTGNLVEAHRIYSQVVLKAPAGSDLYKEAKESATALKDQINRERGKPSTGKKRIGIKDTELAGQEFVDRQEEFLKQCKSFDLAPVRAEMERLRDNTREATPERGAIELGLQRLGYLEKLLAIVQSRVETLPADRARWSNFDFSASSDLVAVSAGPEGITLKDELTGDKSVKAWTELHPSILVAFLDALRNKASANECLWLGYYCSIMEDPTADAYFDFAVQLDDSKAMKAEVAALRGEG